ncbi:MAG: hypothetical protein IKN56_00800 [Clostridia bacterium]|nr:hypothetical protein [Clostridia bacterium]
MKTCKKLLSAVLCLVFVFGIFGTSAFAAGSGIKSVSFPEEFQTCKMIVYDNENYDIDTGVYPASIDFTMNDGTVVSVNNEMNEYGFNAGFSGTLNANGAAQKVAAYYTDLKEDEKITFHITVDGAEVYCEEAKIVYSQLLVDLLFFQAKALRDFAAGGSFDILNLLKVNQDFLAFRKLMS